MTFDSDLGQLRERFALLQSALTDSENWHARRDRQDASILRVLKALIDSPLFDHRACPAVSHEISDDCICGYSDLATELYDAAAVRAAEIDERKAERAEMRETFKAMKRESLP